MTSREEENANEGDCEGLGIEDLIMSVDRAEGRRILGELLGIVNESNGDGSLHILDSSSTDIVSQQQMEIEARELTESLDTIQISLLHINSVRSCVICIVKFDVGQDACQMFCHNTHIFHHDCFRRWLEKKKECPVCKTPVPYPYHKTISTFT